MTSKEVEITFRVEPEQAAALLKFLRRVGFGAVVKAVAGAEEAKAFTEASERLRVALGQVVEPEQGYSRQWPTN
jgi:hypothetical protein